MASDEATIHHILGLLDRHSFKTIEHAVQQFNDHKQRFRESLSDLKSLKPPTGGDCLNVFTRPPSHGMQARCTPLKRTTGGDFSNVFAHPSSHVMQARCTPLKLPLSSTLVPEGTENHGMPLKPRLSSTFVQEGTENNGNKHTLRPRPPRKLSTLGVPQRVTRSRAKQPATSTAAACNIPTKADFMVLEDDFVEVRSKVNRTPERHQQTSFQGEVPAEATTCGVPKKEATTSGCGKANSNQSLEHAYLNQSLLLWTSSQDVIAATTAQNQSVSCKRELLTPSSVKCLKDPEKEGFNAGATALSLNSTEKFCLLSPHRAQQIRLSKTGNLDTPHGSIGNCNLHEQSAAAMLGTSHRSSARTHSVNRGVAVLAKPATMSVGSPMQTEQAPKETNDAVQFNAKQEKPFPTNAEDGPCIVCPKEDDALSLQLSPITVKHSPSSIRKKILVTNGRQSSLWKRKLSICGGSLCGIVADDYHSARKRYCRYCSITISRNSIELEAFKFEGDDVHDELRRPVSERVSTPENMDTATTKEFRVGTDETFLGEFTNCIASEGLCGISSEAHDKVAEGGPHAWDNNSQDLRCVLKDIHTGKPAFRNSFQVTTQEVHQACEKIEPSFDNTMRTRIEESNCDNQPKTPEKQGILVSEFTLADQPLVSDMDSLPVHFSTRLQPKKEKEMCSLSKSDLLLTTSLQGVESCLHEPAEVELTLWSGVTVHPTEVLASGNTAAVYDDLPPQKKAVDKVMFSHTQERSKSDVLRSPELKVIAQDCMPSSSPGIRRSPASNSIEQMESNLLLSATKSMLKYHVNGVANLSCDESPPSVNVKGGFASLSITAFAPMNSAIKEKISADNALVGTDVESCMEKAAADIVLVGTDVDSCCKENASAGNVLVATDIDSCEDRAAADNVLVGTDVDSRSLHTKVEIDENTLHDMEEKPFFSMKSKVGTDTHLPHGVAMASKRADVMPAMEKTENCCREIKLEMPCSQDTECKPSWRLEIYDYEESTVKGVSFGAPSPSGLKDDLQVESSTFILNMETKESTVHKTDDGDDISNTGSQMDCSETPNSSVRLKEIKDKSGQFHLENEATTELKLTPKGDETILNFSQILAQGTVSSRRKRPRSPANFSEESCKDFKKMKFSTIGKGEQILEERLPQSSFDKSSSPLHSFPHLCSPVRGLQGTFGMTFNDSPCGKLHDSGGFDSLPRRSKGSNKVCKSYSRLCALRKEYVDTPHIRSARADLFDGTSTKYKVQKSEWHLDTHVEEEGKENQTPEPWLRGKSYSSTSIISEKQAPANTRTVLGQANQSLGQLEGSHKCYNLAVETRSFLDLVQQKQQPLPYPNGKKEVRVKALEAAELARRQEERREYERKMRRLDCNEAKSTELEYSKDKMMQSCALSMAGKGVTDKVKRVAELKMKMDQEKARKQEVDQRKKEEERKKKEAELADKKRKREDADKKEREEKRKRVEEVQKLRKEQEERQRLELNEKEHKRKMLEERERGKKAQEEEAKRQRRLEKEKEAERRRKQEEHLKAARFAEKQAERKRKEAVLQIRGCEDDLMAQLALGNKLSFISTQSSAVSTSADWEPQRIRTRSQASVDRWGLRVPSLSTSAYCQTNNKKLSMSVFSVENGPPFSTKQVVHEAGFKCEPFTGFGSQYFTPYLPARLESEIQSYEISSYKSSSDDDEDDQPKKPIPVWARKENLLPQLLWQQCIDPDHIFSSEKTCSLGEIFGTTGSRRCKNFTRRSTSGDWLNDLTTKAEELDYKKAMGYAQG